MLKDVWPVIVKGICVGGTMLIPGVSGSSMAMILGIYDRLITSVSSFFEHKKESLWFLSLFSLGGAAGIFLFAKPLSYFAEKYPMLLLYFFMGAVCGSLPMIFKQAGVSKISVRSVLYLLMGIVSLFVFEWLFDFLMLHFEIEGFIAFFVAGVIAAVALVLPGISVSYLLLMMGLYAMVIEAILSFELTVLLPLGIGGLLGIAAVTKLLDRAMRQYSRASYLCIAGFVVASVLKVFPGIPAGLEWISCGLMFGAGFLGVLCLC